MARIPLLFLLLVLLISIGLPVLIILPGIYYPMAAFDFLYLAGKYFALAAFLIITFQYLWTAKLRLLERIRSYDSRVAVHRTLGFLGVLMVALHPVLILGYYVLNGITLTMTIPMVLGFLSLVILLLVVGVTFLGRIWRMRYEAWKKLHWFTFPVLTLAFYHSLYLGSDIYGRTKVFWFALWGFHLAILVLKTIHKLLTWFRTVRILSVDHEAPSVTTIVTERPKTKYLPGQFTFFSAKLGKKWEAWHPFSITSQNDEDRISMTIRGLGDFSSAVANLKPGDPAKLDVGYGGFSPRIANDQKYVLVAGGIGITPIYAILRDLKDQKPLPEVILIYSNHHESDILFRENLESWFKDRENWQLIFVCTSQPDWPGIKGRLTPERITEICKADLNGTFFLCGPYEMVNSISKYLRSKNVPKRKIKREQFVFLP
jgi:predicted ferric reductase